jgi:hypothetical protein
MKKLTSILKTETQRKDREEIFQQYSLPIRPLNDALSSGILLTEKRSLISLRTSN